MITVNRWKDVAAHGLRRTAKASLTLIEQTSHPLRRRIGRSRIRDLRMPMQMLFICDGNIYRSPFAAGCMTRLLPERVRSDLLIGSAGFTGPGRASPVDAVEEAERYGVDLTPHRSSLVHSAMIAEWDLFVVMNTVQARHLAGRFSVDPGRIFLLGDFDPLPIRRRAIPDPWEDPSRVLQPCYARVLRCTEMMAELLTEAWDARSELALVAVRTERVRSNR